MALETRPMASYGGRPIQRTASGSCRRAREAAGDGVPSTADTDALRVEAAQRIPIIPDAIPRVPDIIRRLPEAGAPMTY